MTDRASATNIAGGRLRFAVPLTGGKHQALHLLPVAAALADRGHAVRLLAFDEDCADFCRHILPKLGTAAVDLMVLPMRVLERATTWRTSGAKPNKLLRLLENRHVLADADALIVAERTTSVLRRLIGYRRPIVHVPHGAGDRAVGYEPRIAAYDLHLVAGDKDRRRFVAAGLAAPDRVVACGYFKFFGVYRACPDPPRPFGDDRPVILFNPHCDRRLGAFGAVGPALLDAFANDARFNYIVAPHVNFAAGLTTARRAALLSRAAPNLHIDLGSDRSCDMSYTRAADIYLGDVSSQIYEFVNEPRPAVFIDANRTAWRGDPHFSMWNMGAVVAPDISDIMAALYAASAAQPGFARIQERLAADALGGDWRMAPARAADAILDFMGERSRR